MTDCDLVWAGEAKVVLASVILGVVLGAGGHVCHHRGGVVTVVGSVGLGGGQGLGRGLGGRQGEGNNNSQVYLVGRVCLDHVETNLDLAARLLCIV